MFTGIIQEVGRIKKIKSSSKSSEVEISCNKVIKDIKIGDSISVNGCCLTVKEFTKTSFISDISFYTLQNTTFKNVKMNEAVNLENSLKFSSPLGGHLLTGHIDTTAKIFKIDKLLNSYIYTILVPKEFTQYIVPKGSVALDGISLTVQALELDTKPSNEIKFRVAVIPHTYENTNLKFKKQKDLMNLEIDIIARYIRQIIKFEHYTSITDETDENFKKDKLLMEKLIEYGFLQKF